MNHRLLSLPVEFWSKNMIPGTQTAALVSNTTIDYKMKYFGNHGNRMQLISRRVAGLVLLIFGILKLITSAGETRILSQLDPVTGMTFSHFLQLAGLAETCAGGWMLISKRKDGLWLITIAGFSGAFITYRILLARLGVIHWCPCLGNLGDWWPWLSLHIKAVSNSALGLLLTALALGAFSRSVGNGPRQGHVSTQAFVRQLPLLLIAASLMAATQAKGAIEIKGRMIQKLYTDGTNFATYISPFTVEQRATDWSICQEPNPLGTDGFLGKDTYCAGGTLTSLTVFKMPTNIPIAMTNRIDIHYATVPDPDWWRTRWLWFTLINTNFSNTLVKTNLSYLNFYADPGYSVDKYALTHTAQPDGSQLWTLDSDGSIPVGGAQHLFVSPPFPCTLLELATDSATGTVATATQLTMDSPKGPPTLCWTLAVVVDSRSVIPIAATTEFAPPKCLAIVHDYRLMAGNDAVTYLSVGNILGVHSPTLANIRQGLIAGQQFGFHLWPTVIILSLAILPPLAWVAMNRTKQKHNQQLT